MDNMLHSSTKATQLLSGSPQMGSWVGQPDFGLETRSFPDSDNSSIPFLSGPTTWNSHTPDLHYGQYHETSLPWVTSSSSQANELPKTQRQLRFVTATNLLPSQTTNGVSKPILDLTVPSHESFSRMTNTWHLNSGEDISQKKRQRRTTEQKMQAKAIRNRGGPCDFCKKTHRMVSFFDIAMISPNLF
jgi:hypothetical protein